MKSISLQKDAPRNNSRRLVFFFGLITVAFLLGSVTGCGERAPEAPPVVQEGPWSGFPVSVRDAMARGVNASNWFVNRHAPGLEPGWPTEKDFALMREMGLGHVRILFDPDWLKLNAAHPRYLEQAIEQANAAGLLVVIALQPSTELKHRALEDDSAVAEMERIWRVLARKFSEFSDESLIFEVLNEPEIEDDSRNLIIQSRLVNAVRNESPDRIVSVGGAHFSDIDDLEKMRPLRANRVIYNFHFYEPHNFTHQGASWGWHMWLMFKNMPYPSSPAAVSPILESLPEVAREHAEWYGSQAWNREKLAEFVERAGAWSRQHRVPIWCSEFGVLKNVAPEGARRNWLKDATDLFAQNGIVWSYFDWWGHFGMVSGNPEKRRLDAEVREGLKLTEPRDN